MRHHRALFALLLAAIALIAAAFLAAAPLLLPARASLALTVATEPVPRLLPHAHTGADKVGDLHHGIAAHSAAVKVPETMWVAEAVVRVENAPREVIHHLRLLRLNEDGTESNLLTVGQDSMEVFRFPAPAGILLSEGDEIMVDAVLHNPVPPLGEGGIYDEVSVGVELRGVRDGEGRHLPVNFALIRVTDSAVEDGGDSTFTVPAGAESFARKSEQNPKGARGHLYAFAHDGWIVHMGAHLHSWEGGERIDAYLNGEPEPAWSFRSRHTDADAPWRVATDAGPSLIPFSAGDFVTISATYSNQGREPVTGAMGMLGIYYVVDDGTASSPWPEARFQAARVAYALLDAMGLL